MLREEVVNTDRFQRPAQFPTPITRRTTCVILPSLLLFCTVSTRANKVLAAETEPEIAGHPRLYCTAEDLVRLRPLKTEGVRARIWDNLARSADWCADQPPRSEWIAPAADDPQFENLYDRFYAAMHDMAVIEHLAFASALSDQTDDPYFPAARSWTLAGARVWKHEADHPADAGKAYAVLRVLKALAVSYDLLYDRLTETERTEIREALIAVARRYFEFFQAPSAAGPGYNKHHGSVDAAPFGVVALALLGETPEASAWLEQMVRKHTEFLLPHGLTPSGTNEQSSNFWASTLHYRIFFLDALRRVTGRDLAAEFPHALPGRMALAAVAGQHPRDLQYNESNRSVLFGPCYGQLDYWSPVLVYLAREQRRPVYQHLALWDYSLGSIQRTRFITPNRKEELLFSFGGYAYLWYDPAVPDKIESHLPLSFEFPEPEVNEAYLRASYEPKQIVVGMRKGGLAVHAGGRPVLVDQLPVNDVNAPAQPVDEMLVADDGLTALIRCIGPKSAGIAEQRVELRRPSRLVIRRETEAELNWWYAGEPQRDANQLSWPDGTTLTVTRGSIVDIDPQGYLETKVHYAGMKFADPHPFVYPVVTARPDQGVLELTVTVPQPALP